MKKYLLGVDNGGTYIKAALYDFKGKQIGITKEYNEKIIPGVGMSEYNQDTLWQINCNCIKNVIEGTGIDPNEIACLGISGQGCGFYAIDSKGQNICNAISSSDQRAVKYVEKWEKDGTSEKLFDLIFRYSTPGHINAILAWLKDNEPDNYDKIAYLFSMKDFLIYRLTGEVVSGYGCQSASCLMNMNTNEFDKNLADAFGIQEVIDKFGPLKWDIEICGYITDEAADLCGCMSGTPVCGGCHDVVASIIAMGVDNSAPFFVITGTHAINGYISDTPILDKSVLSTELFAFPGGYMIEDSFPASSGILEWVIDLFYSREEKTLTDIYNEINQMVDSISPDESDLIFLPYLNGQRDNLKARGTWIGLLPHHTKAHMFRAVYEAVAFTHMRHLENLFNNRTKPEMIRMAGGATNSTVWIQLFADVIDIPLHVVPKEEMGTKGAAIVAAVSAKIYPDVKTAISNMTSVGKVFEPRQDFSAIYQKKYLRFKSIVNKTDSIWTDFN